VYYKILVNKNTTAPDKKAEWTIKSHALRSCGQWKDKHAYCSFHISFQKLFGDTFILPLFFNWNFM